MKTLFLIVVILCSLNSFSQTQNINNYDELIKFQNSIKSTSKIAIVWGHFGGWGKFGWNSYKDICPGFLSQEEYSGLLSALSFKLFSDSTTTYYLPIKKSAQVLTEYRTDDIIKLKIKLYENCKTNNGKIYFLIMEIL